MNISRKYLIVLVFMIVCAHVCAKRVAPPYFVIVNNTGDSIQLKGITEDSTSTSSTSGSSTSSKGGFARLGTFLRSQVSPSNCSLCDNSACITVSVSSDDSLSTIKAVFDSYTIISGKNTIKSPKPCARDRDPAQQVSCFGTTTGCSTAILKLAPQSKYKYPFRGRYIISLDGRKNIKIDEDVD